MRFQIDYITKVSIACHSEIPFTVNCLRKSIKSDLETCIKQVLCWTDTHHTKNLPTNLPVDPCYQI
jgi:hypothetical protein